jgi:type VI secretion system protein ImpE
MNASELYRDGRLKDAVEAATASVKAKPDDAGTRNFLAELLCFAGDFERADKQLDALSQVHPDLAVTVALSRQLLRAAMWRRQFYQEGRVPEFADKPSPALQSHLQASVHVRAGEEAAAAKLLAEAKGAKAPVSGTCNGAAFDDIRDLDDLLSPVLEVLTANGKYYWIAFEQVASIELTPAKRPRDLIWRPAQIVVRNGPEGEVFIPVLYPGSENASDPLLQLGRSTDWSDGQDGPVRGLGQRMLLVGDDASPFLEIETFTTS